MPWASTRTSPGRQRASAPSSGTSPTSSTRRRGESWQRVGVGAARLHRGTGDAGRAEPSGALTRVECEVVITELAGSGPGGAEDDFVEVQNTGDRPVDLGGWALWRCTATGRLGSHQLQLTIAEGTVLEPGDAGSRAEPASRAPTRPTRPTSPISSSARCSGMRRAHSSTGSRCHHSVTARARGRSCARCSTRSPPSRGSAPTRVGSSPTERRVCRTVRPSTACSSTSSPTRLPWCRDQRDRHGPQHRGDAGGQHPAQLDRARQLRPRAGRDLGLDGPPLRGGRPARHRSAVHGAGGTTLDPGETYLAARAGTPAADDANITYDIALNLLGTGVWVEDADGRRVDSVGIYAANEMDSTQCDRQPVHEGRRAHHLPAGPAARRDLPAHPVHRQRPRRLRDRGCDARRARPHRLGRPYAAGRTDRTRHPIDLSH